MLGYVALIVRASTLEVLQSRSPAILAGSGARRFSICSTIHIWLRLLSTIFPKWWPLTALINGFEATIFVLQYYCIQLELQSWSRNRTEQARLTEWYWCVLFRFPAAGKFSIVGKNYVKKKLNYGLLTLPSKSYLPTTFSTRFGAGRMRGVVSR